ncbi:MULTISPECIES: acyltransferase [Chitinibacter]|uniref:acyltransferase n=1 Tax=Chitinibacter TaxID=230666 RepID=UPI0003FDD79D|nr:MULTISPECIES: acyltransferase [Chitinibacter]
MSTLYQNIFLFDPVAAGQPVHDAHAVLSAQGVEIHASTVVSGTPRVAFTRVADARLQQHGLIASEIAAEDFAGSIRIGRNCYLESGQLPAFHTQPSRLTSVQINDEAPGQISIGNGVVLQGVAIVAYQRVEIADEVMFGPMVTIMDSSGHPLLGRGQPGEAMKIRSAPVRIGRGAWIGTGATILKGVTIGEGAIVGAQAVVSEDVPPYCVVLGNPARLVKRISTAHERKNAAHYAELTMAL